MYLSGWAAELGSRATSPTAIAAAAAMLPTSTIGSRFMRDDDGERPLLLLVVVVVVFVVFAGPKLAGSNLSERVLRVNQRVLAPV